MFRIIVFLFTFINCLVFYQATLTVLPNYQTYKYIETQGKITSNQIINDNNKYYVFITYSYQPYFNGQIYQSSKINLSDTYLFNSFEKARYYSSAFHYGKNIDVFFDHKNPNNSLLIRGISLKDYNLFFHLLCLIFFNLAIICLAYIEGWKFFSYNKKMHNFSYAFSILFFTSLCISFYYICNNITLSIFTMKMFLILYAALFLLVYLFRRVKNKKYYNYYKYNRLFNTQEIEERERNPIKNSLYQFRHEGILPLFMINSTILLIILLLFIINKFSLNLSMINTTISLFIFSILYIVFYLNKTYLRTIQTND